MIDRSMKVYVSLRSWR